MIPTSAEWTAQIIDHTRRLEEYKVTLRKLFPALQRELLEARSLRDVDAIVLALFLRSLPPGLSVLEVGTSFGVATFHLASQPGVLRVLGVEPEPEAGDTSTIPDTESDPLKGAGSQDFARAALAEFAAESAKIQLRKGAVDSAWTAPSDPPEGLVDAGPSGSGLSADEPLLAFLNGAPERESVEEDLRSIFDASPHAVAVIDHCRGARGPFVQAGIAGFLNEARGKYRFRLFGDLSSGVATSNLGIVYPDADSTELEGCLEDLAQLFSDRLDPLWLASREQEMIGIVNTYKDEAATLNGQYQDLAAEHKRLAAHNTGVQKRVSQLEERKAILKGEKQDLKKRTSQLERRVSQLEQHNARLKEEKTKLQKNSSRVEKRNSRLKEERLLLDAQLSEFRASGRYRLADAITKNVLRIPGAKSLARRARPEK
jgi:hypothetical protein